MNENWSEKKFLEKCRSMSFQELSECIEEFLDELDKSPKSVRENPVFNNNDLYEKIWGLLESKFLDGFVTEKQRNSFIEKYQKYQKDYKKREIGKKKSIINGLKGRIRSLELIKDKINLSERDLVILYEKLNPNINLGKFKVQDNSAKPFLFIEVAEYKTSPGFNFPVLTKFIRLNPKYESQSEIKELYQQFIEELPNFIDVFADNMNKDLAKHDEELQNLKDIFASQDLREKAINYLETELYFQFKLQLSKRRELIVSLRSKKRKIFEKVKFEIIPFDIFPKGDVTISEFVQILRSSGMSISNEDEMRLHRIGKAFPSYQSICVGKDKFKGFVVFRFENTDVVIVEKPFYGNATYLIKGDWEQEVIKILQLNRNNARARFYRQVKRVIHTSERQWLSTLKFESKYWH